MMWDKQRNHLDQHIDATRADDGNPSQPDSNAGGNNRDDWSLVSGFTHTTGEAWTKFQKTQSAATTTCTNTSGSTESSSNFSSPPSSPFVSTRIEKNSSFNDGFISTQQDNDDKLFEEFPTEIPSANVEAEPPAQKLASLFRREESARGYKKMLNDDDEKVEESKQIAASRAQIDVISSPAESPSKSRRRRGQRTPMDISNSSSVGRIEKPSRRRSSSTSLRTGSSHSQPTSQPMGRQGSRRSLESKQNNEAFSKSMSNFNTVDIWAEDLLNKGPDNDVEPSGETPKPARQRSYRNSKSRRSTGLDGSKHSASLHTSDRGASPSLGNSDDRRKMMTKRPSRRHSINDFSTQAAALFAEDPIAFGNVASTANASFDEPAQRKRTSRHNYTRKSKSWAPDDDDNVDTSLHTTSFHGEDSELSLFGMSPKKTLRKQSSRGRNLKDDNKQGSSRRLSSSGGGSLHKSRSLSGKSTAGAKQEGEPSRRRSSSSRRLSTSNHTEDKETSPKDDDRGEIVSPNSKQERSNELKARYRRQTSKRNVKTSPPKVDSDDDMPSLADFSPQSPRKKLSSKIKAWKDELNASPPIGDETLIKPEPGTTLASEDGNPTPAGQPREEFKRTRSMSPAVRKGSSLAMGRSKSLRSVADKSSDDENPLKAGKLDAAQPGFGERMSSSMLGGDLSHSLRSLNASAHGIPASSPGKSFPPKSPRVSRPSGDKKSPETLGSPETRRKGANSMQRSDSFRSPRTVKPRRWLSLEAPPSSEENGAFVVKTPNADVPAAFRDSVRSFSNRSSSLRLITADSCDDDDIAVVAPLTAPAERSSRPAFARSSSISMTPKVPRPPLLGSPPSQRSMRKTPAKPQS